MKSGELFGGGDAGDRAAAPLARAARSVTFAYDITPLKVRKTEQRAGTWLGFCTRCAAVIGGARSDRASGPRLHAGNSW